MSDVIIVYPRTGFDTKGMSITLPLSVLGAASGVVGEFDVCVIDQRTDDNWQEEIKKELNSRTICVALSSMTGTQIHYALEVTRFVKQINPDIPIVWGGMHATLMPEQTLQNPHIDYILKGEAEVSLRELLRTLTNGHRLEKVPSLGWKKKDGSVCINSDGSPLDMNTLPPIPYHLVDVEHYTTPSEYIYGWNKRLLPYQGSRGCPYKCTFCSEPALTKTYRMIKPERFYEDTAALCGRYNLDHVNFYDEEFFVNTRWSTKIAELINGKFTWTAQARADDLLRVDLKKMERYGLKVVWPGLESGSDRVLKWIKKRETVSQFIEANRLVAKTGIIPKYNFIIGFPGETQEELNMTVDLALKLLKDNPRASVNSFSPLVPLPGTELLTIAVKDYGFEPPQTLEDWIGISRRQLPTPWVRKKMVVHQNLMYTSVFLNSAKRFSRAYWWIPPFIFDIYTWIIKFRWKKHVYRNSWDIKLIRLAHRFFSPVDFLGKKSC